MPASAWRRRSCASATAWKVPGGDRAADAEPGQPAPQLARGLTGERDREDVVRVEVPARGLPRDPAGQRAGLARPAGARIASGTTGSVTAARWVGSRSESSSSARTSSTYRWVGTGLGGCVATRSRPRTSCPLGLRSPRLALPEPGPRRERAPSSLGCGAAPISSGLRPSATPSAPTSTPLRRRRGRSPATAYRSSTVAHRLDRPARGPDLRSGFGSDAPAFPGLVFRGPSAPAALAGHPRFRPGTEPRSDRTAMVRRGPEPSREFLVSGTFGNVTQACVTQVDVSEERFESMVADALDEIPDELASKFENVAVMVQDWPTEAQLGGPARHAARALRGHRPAPALAARLQRRHAGPDHDLPRAALRAGARRGRARGNRCASPCCTRSATTSGSRSRRLHELGWA